MSNCPVQNITATEYAGFQTAFDFFNRELFGGGLPEVMITLQRGKRFRGYFWAEQYSLRGDAEVKVHELALNPDAFGGRTDQEILSTLVHEMCHVWQESRGKSPRKGYHDREWGSQMKRIGLHPSDTGAPGGKETGQKMTHYVVQDGPFEKLVEDFTKSYKLHWQANKGERGAGAAKKQTRQKFTCPSCGANAWAKFEAALACGQCSEREGDLIKMEAAE